ncbi:MAG: DUF58 domain-containing protein [Candidatus Hydrogenedentes bacterium]|nr:DUF58 domain-containing protein [Candidatus Hydrogenedentota bacterium]
MTQGKLKLKKKNRSFQIGVILFSLLLLLSAWNSGNNILYLAFAISFAFLIVGEFFGNFNLGKFRVYVLAPDQVVKGEIGNIWLRLESFRKLFPSLGLNVEIIIKFQSGEIKKVFVKNVPIVFPLQGVDISFGYMFGKRGKALIERVIVYSYFPFGLVRYQVDYELDIEILVTPRYRALNIEVLGNYIGGCRIPVKTLLSESGEFYSLREYQPGDDIRYIAWKISARVGVWLVREWAVSMPNQYVIYVDLRTRGTQDDESFEEMIEFTASIVYSLLGKQFKVGLYVGGGEKVPVNGGNAHFSLILRILALVSPERRYDIDEDVWKKFLAEGRNSRLLLISILPELWDEGSLNGMKVAVPDGIRR